MVGIEGLATIHFLVTLEVPDFSRGNWWCRRAWLIFDFIEVDWGFVCNLQYFLFLFVKIFLASWRHEGADFAGADIFIFELLILWHQHSLGLFSLQVLERLRAWVSGTSYRCRCSHQVGCDGVFRSHSALMAKRADLCAQAHSLRVNRLGHALGCKQILFRLDGVGYFTAHCRLAHHFEQWVIWSFSPAIRLSVTGLSVGHLGLNNLHLAAHVWGIGKLGVNSRGAVVCILLKYAAIALSRIISITG